MFKYRRIICDKYPIFEDDETSGERPVVYSKVLKSRDKAYNGELSEMDLVECLSEQVMNESMNMR